MTSPQERRDLSTHEPCLLCHSHDTKRETHSLILCRTCNFFFVNRAERARQQALFLTRADEPPDPHVLSALKAKYSRQGHAKQAMYRRFAKRFVRHFGASLSVLDVGASGGFFLKEVEALGASRERLVTLELDPAFLALTRDYFDYRGWVGNVEDISPPHHVPSTYDVITLFDVLEHVNHFEKALERLSCLLKPGGRVFLKLPGGRWALLKYRIARLLRMDAHIPSLLYLWPGGHLNYWDLNNIARLTHTDVTLVSAHYLRPTWRQFGIEGWWRYLLYPFAAYTSFVPFPEFVVELERQPRRA